jgi:hypothetical protein
MKNLAARRAARCYHLNLLPAISCRYSKWKNYIIVTMLMNYGLKCTGWILQPTLILHLRAHNFFLIAEQFATTLSFLFPRDTDHTV